VHVLLQHKCLILGMVSHTPIYIKPITVYSNFFYLLFITVRLASWLGAGLKRDI